MPALEKLKPDEKCPKCGDDRISRNWNRERDEIDLSCLACTFAWKRAPLDAD